MEWLKIKKALTIEEVRQVERDLSITLPSDYVSLIGNINGGALRNAWIELPHVGRVPYTRNVSLSKGSPASVYELFGTCCVGHKNYFPFGSVGNGDYFSFDLQNHTIVLFLHESATVVPVCSSYTQFLQMIQTE